MGADRDSRQLQAVKARATVVVGLIGALAGLLLAPPIFSSAFAMSFLLRREVIGLWLLCGVVLVSSALMILARLRIRFEAVALFFSILILMGLELGARLVVVAFFPETRTRLARLANVTYPELWTTRGHPFLQITGNPSGTLIENRYLLDELTHYNNLGFVGDDFRFEKPGDVIRIATLGGSTTATGYPELMEEFLNENKNDDSHRFEVLNFGLGFWTSAHSLVNFVLNVVDFSPDYVVIHQGWNDRVVRNTPSGFRNDYSHALQYFHEPTILDKVPIRASILYRYAKFKLFQVPNWVFIEQAVVIGDRPTTERKWENLDELKPFRRNIGTIIDLAGLRGMKVIVTTQPHSTDPDIPLKEQAPQIDQANAVMRDIHDEYGDTVLFVDLDEMMTGKMNEVFRDIGHVTDAGRAFKAEQIGRAILSDLTENAWTRPVERHPPH